ncbi:SRPBCC domain-containing protein [Arthrobacter sp. efr-133-TYG-104]|uniref:SRPBCC family protein n=1 Tax=Arthrobacter sp. efr-133-TYG-104 TaxID=3040324 RepID=UPI00254ECF88|nr:SRPBCC domain-containing protein [Arthrobacter sp. efr-133-TYG-104]
MTENAIRLERTFPHPKESVWAALTTPQLLARWWTPGDIAPVVGHRFTLDMGGWGVQQCEVLAVELGTSISFAFAEGVLDTTITWTLETVDGGTTLHFEHAGFRLDTPMGQQALHGMGNGWPGLIARIDQVLVNVG